MHMEHSGTQPLTTHHSPPAMALLRLPDVILQPTRGEADATTLVNAAMVNAAMERWSTEAAAVLSPNDLEHMAETVRKQADMMMMNRGYNVEFTLTLPGADVRQVEIKLYVRHLGVSAP